jgi:hypothetical protein
MIGHAGLAGWVAMRGLVLCPQCAARVRVALTSEGAALVAVERYAAEGYGVSDEQVLETLRPDGRHSAPLYMVQAEWDALPDDPTCRRRRVIDSRGFTWVTHYGCPCGELLRYVVVR